jgi:hypothetical protein
MTTHGVALRIEQVMNVKGLTGLRIPQASLQANSAASSSGCSLLCRNGIIDPVRRIRPIVGNPLSQTPRCGLRSGYYILAVSQFARHFGRSPEQLNGEQARQYLLHLVQEKHARWSRYNIARCALQFLYQTTLGRADERFATLPCARVPKRLPTVLSADELRRLFDVAARDVKHKALLMTLYASGLRVSELAALRPGRLKISHPGRSSWQKVTRRWMGKETRGDFRLRQTLRSESAA